MCRRESVESSVRGGLRARGAARRGSGITAYQLLGGHADDPFPTPELDVPPELLADLYGESLIITADYVGADRRTSPSRHRLDRGGHGSSLRSLQILLIVAATAVVTVFLTLTASHPAVPGASGPTGAPTTAASTVAARSLAFSGPATGSRSQAGRAAALAAARASARAGVARQRAARRAEAKAADLSHQRAARSIRVRAQQARRRAARARRHELEARRTRTRKR